MKILLATSQFAPEIGGVPSLLWAFCRQQPQGVSLRVLSIRQQEEAFYTEFDREAPFPIERVAPEAGFGRTSLRFARRLRQIIQAWQPDILLCGVAYPTAILAHLASWGERVPLVVYAHSEDVTIPDPVRRGVLGFILRRARAVLTVSQFTANELGRLGVTASRIQLIPPGIEIEPLAQARPRNDWPGKWVLLTIARLIPRKGQDTIIRALPAVIARHPQVHYVIGGYGPHEDALRTLAADLGVADHVTFAGCLSDAELPSYYAGCNAFAMITRPGESEVEGFGITFLEAGAAAKPVIGGRAGGAVDAVQDNRTGLLVEPEDVAAVAGAINQLIEQPDLAAQLGRQGQRRVQANYSADAFARRVYAALAAAEPGQPARANPPVEPETEIITPIS